MIRLKQFYALLNRNAEVTIKSHTGTEILFEGMVRDIPDRFDECGVDEFQVRPVGSVVFRIAPASEHANIGDGLWCESTLSVCGETYQYHMKQYEEGSAFGIDGGRISKLTMTRDGKTVCRYDRGWDIKPSDPGAELALDILLHTENY